MSAREPSLSKRAIEYRRSHRGKRTSNSNFDYLDGGAAWCYICDCPHSWAQHLAETQKGDSDDSARAQHP